MKNCYFRKFEVIFIPAIMYLIILYSIFFLISVLINHESLLYSSEEKIKSALNDPITYNLANNCDYGIYNENVKIYCSALSKRMDNLNQSSFLLLRAGDLVSYLDLQKEDKVNNYLKVEKENKISCLASGKCQ